MWMLTRNLLLLYKKFFIRIMGIIITLGDAFISLPTGILASVKPKKTVPPTQNNILLTPAVILAQQIRDQTLTSELLTKTFINRIIQVNPMINAMVETRFQEAINEAREADQLINSGLYRAHELEEKFPLLGVPITIKESIAVYGMSNNAGLICNRGKARKDADVVQKIKESGGIIIGVTNTPELCMNWECINNITGSTSNPFDNRRTSGGSSGGEAALISSAASIIGIGSDTLGSLRLPAHFCGIFSHKPTSRTVSIEGHFPDAEERNIWKKVFTLGPMTRYSIDLPFLLRIICKDDKIKSLNLDEQIDFSGITIFYMDCLGDRLTHPVIPEIAEAIYKTVKYFNEIHNTKIEKWTLPELRRTAGRSLTSLIAIKGIDDIFNKDPNRSVVIELLKYFLGCSKHILFAICYLFLNRFYLPYNIETIRKKISVSEKIISDTLGDKGVLICPVFPTDALYHGQVLTKSYSNIYMSVFNSLGFPVTTCPVGLSRNELPIGLQIAGKENADRLTIAVAQEMELLFGGWTSPWINSKPDLFKCVK